MAEQRRTHPLEILLLAAPLVLAGVSAVVAARRWIGSTLVSRSQAIRHAWDHIRAGESATDALRQAIVGSGKGAVLAALGPPRSTSQGNFSPRSIWRGMIWYYPLDPDRQTAIAIRFHGNVAAGMDIIATPRAPAANS